jgi:hypothetical protein
MSTSRPAGLLSVTAWELSRPVHLVQHPAVERPWQDPRWFRVMADDLITETDAPEDTGMYPASGPFAVTQSWTDDDDGAVLDVCKRISCARDTPDFGVKT